MQRARRGRPHLPQSGTGRATSFERASGFGGRLLEVLGASAADHAPVMGLDVDAIVDATNRLSPDMTTSLIPATGALCCSSPWAPTRKAVPRRGAFGACHALEMPFVFGTLDAPTQDASPAPAPMCRPSPGT